MEPMSPTPGPTPESVARPAPEISAQPIERVVQPSPEAKIGGESNATNTQPVTQPAAPVALPQLPTPQAPPPVAAISVNDNPLVAADDDVIEKEWVQKAKQVVEQTKTDPHQQEAEVSKLQADYIQKRYGKQVKLAGE